METKWEENHKKKICLGEESNQIPPENMLDALST
jgi:hypothetical protein